MHKELFNAEEAFIASSLSIIKEVGEAADDLAYIGLSGGSTPKPLYAALAGAADIDASKLMFYVVDERQVPPTDEASNQHMIRETLLKPLHHTQAGFHYFDTNLSPAESLHKYEAELAAIPSGKLDLVILGMGTDGHTASLFPHTEALKEAAALVTQGHAKETAVPRRLTMTSSYLQEAKQILVLTRGAEKARVLEELEKHPEDTDSMPMRFLLHHPNIKFFHLEK